MHKNKNKEKNVDSSQDLSRRKFLKKSVYSVPVVLALGQLVKPISAHADSTGGPDGPPDDWDPW